MSDARCQITIVIPLEIPSQNRTGRGRTWRVRAALTRQIRSAWALHARSAMAAIRAAPADRPRSLHVIAYRKRLVYDIANLIGGAKACIDGLVDAGMLTDDRDTAARITYEQRLASDPRGQVDRKPCTVVIAFDIPSPPAQQPATQEYTTP